MKQLSINQELRVSANNTCVYDTDCLSVGLVTATEIEYLIEQLEDIKARMVRINGALGEVTQESLNKLYTSKANDGIPF